MASQEQSNNAIKAGLWYTIGNILVKGIAFLTLPLFTILMDTEQYGIYNTFAAYVSIGAVIVSLGLPSSVRNVRYDFPEEENQYHINSTILIAGAFCIFIIMALIFREQLVSILGLSLPIILITVINSTCTALHSYFNNILTIDYRYHQFLKLSFFYSTTSVLLSALLIVFVFPADAAVGRALGNMIPMALIAGYVFFRVWKQGTVRMNRTHTRYGLRFGLPLIPNDLSSLLLAQFDRIMIFRIIGEAESGLYCFAYNVAVIYQVVTTSIESAWTPWMFSRINERNHKDIREKINIYVAALTLGTIMMLLVSPEIIMLLSSNAYWESRSVVIPILFAMYFFAVASIPVGIEFYHKKTGWISACTFGTAICNILLNMFFIPRFGYHAAAYTTLASYFLYALFHMAAASKLEPIYMLKMPAVLLSVLCILIVSGISQVALHRPLVRWGMEGGLILVLMIAAFHFRKQLMQFIVSILNKR